MKYKYQYFNMNYASFSFFIFKFSKCPIHILNTIYFINKIDPKYIYYPERHPKLRKLQKILDVGISNSYFRHDGQYV